MDLALVQEDLRPYDQCRILGRPFSAGPCAGELIALTRRGEEAVRLHILQYDSTYSERLAEAEEAAWEEPALPPSTPRESMLREREAVSPDLAVAHVKSLRWGEERLEISGSQYGVMPENDVPSLLLLGAFLREGWRPGAPLDGAALERCALSEIELRCHALPEGPGEGPLVIEPGDTTETYTAQVPVTLTAGEMDLSLAFGGDGGEHTAYLHRMKIADLWEEYRALFCAHRSREGLTAEDLAAIGRSERNLLELLPEVCPEGMGLPTVEYEIAGGEEISLDLWSREVLDGPLRPGGSSALLFLAKPEEGTGPHGLPLRACVLRGPVPLDTQAVEAELFRWHRRVCHPPIVL